MRKTNHAELRGNERDLFSEAWTPMGFLKRSLTHTMHGSAKHLYPAILFAKKIAQRYSPPSPGSSPSPWITTVVLLDPAMGFLISRGSLPNFAARSYSRNCVGVWHPGHRASGFPHAMPLQPHGSVSLPPASNSSRETLKVCPAHHLVLLPPSKVVVSELQWNEARYYIGLRVINVSRMLEDAPKKTGYQTRRRAFHALLFLPRPTKSRQQSLSKQER